MSRKGEWERKGVREEVERKRGREERWVCGRGERKEEEVEEEEVEW